MLAQNYPAVGKAYLYKKIDRLCLSSFVFEPPYQNPVDIQWFLHISHTYIY